MENPSQWSNATRVIAEALIDWQTDDDAGTIGFSQAQYVKLRLEEAGYLTPRALEIE